MELTQARLRELLHYDTETGVFKWIVVRNGRIRSDRIAGGAYNHEGYIRIRIDGRAYQASRLAWLYMTGSWPRDQIDHINKNPADNSFTNLREATPSQNMANKGVHKNNLLGVKGVRKDGARYRANIRIDGKLRHLGLFDTIDEASRAYLQEAQKRHGEFARAS